MTRKRVAVVVAFCLLFGACGSNRDASETTVGAPDTAPPSTAVAAMDHLRVLILPYVTFSPYYIAIEEGYFEEQGIEVEVVNMTATEDVMPALSSGQVDVASGLISAGMLNAIARGAEVAITADKGYIDPDGCLSFTIVGRSGLVDTDDLETADQLAGKTINVVPATWLEYYLGEVLATGDLGFDDINTVYVGSAAMVDALASEQVDATVDSEPWLSIFTSQGHGAILSSPQELLPNDSVAVQIYGPNLLNENRDLGVRFMAAYLKGVEQYAGGATERNVDIVAGFTELDRGLLESMCWPAINPTGEVVVDGVLGFQEFAVERGYLDEIVPADEFYDGSFIEDAGELMGASG